MAYPLQPSFWENEAKELKAALTQLLLVTFLDAAQEGTQALPVGIQVLVDFDWVNTAALEFAQTYGYEMVKGITAATQKVVEKALTDWIASGEPLSALEENPALLNAFGEVRASMIAVTETTRVYAEGNMGAWESSGLVGSRRWMTAEDDVVCDICGALDGEERGLDELFGDVDNPPAHVNCRCWIQPIVDEDAVAARIDAILNSD